MGLLNDSHAFCLSTHIKQFRKYFVDKNNNEIERTMKIDSEMVTLWRNRYVAAEKELAITEEENPRKLRKVIEKLLTDTPRSGRPSTFTDVQVAITLTFVFGASI